MHLLLIHARDYYSVQGYNDEKFASTIHVVRVQIKVCGH